LQLKQDNQANQKPSSISIQDALVQTRMRMAALSDIIINLESTMSFEEILTLAVEKTTEVMGATRTTLFLIEEDGSLVSRIIEGDEAKEITLQPGAGLAGWTARHGMPLLVPDAYEDDRFDKSWDEQTGFKTNDVLCHPIFGRTNKVTGVVEVLNSKKGTFNKDDVVMLGTVAVQLAMVIENSRLIVDLVDKNRQITTSKIDLEKKNQELDLLLELEKIYARSDSVDNMGEGAFSKILEIFDCQIASLYLLDSDGATKRVYLKGGQSSFHRVEAGSGFTGWVAAKNTELRLEEPKTDPRYGLSIGEKVGIEFENLAAAPIPFSDDFEISGSIMVCNRAANRKFDDTDMVILRLVASQMSSAIEHLLGREQREREHRLATVGRLLAGVLHDLKTPITAIWGYAEMLAETEKKEERKDYLQHIKNSLDRIKTMTSDIVAFARGERDFLITSCVLDNFLEEFIDEIGNYLKAKNIELLVRKRTSGTIKIDKNRLLRAFHNIATNAAEAMEDGGRLIFEIDRIDDRMIFSFTDTGKGVPEQIRGSLFNSFVSLGKHEGTGLGLALAKRIISGHGGDISFTTATGSGTTFLVTIPG
jgi:signal transduction histidine kinase